MKVITCASYYGTGSSAITDFLTEFEPIYSLTNYEFRFVQDIDGVSDLEYYLVENHNRHNSGHALKRFKKLSDFNGGTKFNKRYEPFFNNQYKKITYEYIDALTDFTFKGYWFYDFYDKGVVYYYCKRLPNKILSKLRPHSENTVTNLLPNEITYCSRPGREKFLKCTREYLDKLMAAANTSGKPYIMVDQIVPPSNVDRFTNYFNDIHVFVVERDPRDLFILSKYIWKDNVVPKETVDLFCKWYEYTRAHRREEKYNPETTMFVRFEDLVYKYDETTAAIQQWLGLSDSEHTRKRECFNPDISIKNTRLWISNPQYAEEIKEIEEKLPEYLYDYSKVL